MFKLCCGLQRKPPRRLRHGGGADGRSGGQPPEELPPSSSRKLARGQPEWQRAENGSTECDQSGQGMASRWRSERGNELVEEQLLLPQNAAYTTSAAATAVTSRELVRHLPDADVSRSSVPASVEASSAAEGKAGGFSDGKDCIAVVLGVDNLSLVVARNVEHRSMDDIADGEGIDGTDHADAALASARLDRARVCERDAPIRLGSEYRSSQRRLVKETHFGESEEVKTDVTVVCEQGWLMLEPAAAAALSAEESPVAAVEPTAIMADAVELRSRVHQGRVYTGDVRLSTRRSAIPVEPFCSCAETAGDSLLPKSEEGGGTVTADRNNGSPSGSIDDRVNVAAASGHGLESIASGCTSECPSMVAEENGQTYIVATPSQIDLSGLSSSSSRIGIGHCEIREGSAASHHGGHPAGDEDTRDYTVEGTCFEKAVKPVVHSNPGVTAELSSQLVAASANVEPRKLLHMQNDDVHHNIELVAQVAPRQMEQHVPTFSTESCNSFILEEGALVQQAIAIKPRLSALERSRSRNLGKKLVAPVTTSDAPEDTLHEADGTEHQHHSMPIVSTDLASYESIDSAVEEIPPATIVPLSKQTDVSDDNDIDTRCANDITDRSKEVDLPKSERPEMSREEDVKPIVAQSTFWEAPARTEQRLLKPVTLKTLDGDDELQKDALATSSKSTFFEYKNVMKFTEDHTLQKSQLDSALQSTSLKLCEEATSRGESALNEASPTVGPRPILRMPSSSPGLSPTGQPSNGDEQSPCSTTVFCHMEATVQAAQLFLEEPSETNMGNSAVEIESQIEVDLKKHAEQSDHRSIQPHAHTGSNEKHLLMQAAFPSISELAGCDMPLQMELTHADMEKDSSFVGSGRWKLHPSPQLQPETEVISGQDRSVEEHTISTVISETVSESQVEKLVLAHAIESTEPPSLTTAASQEVKSSSVIHELSSSEVSTHNPDNKSVIVLEPSMNVSDGHLKKETIQQLHIFNHLLPTATICMTAANIIDTEETVVSKPVDDNKQHALFEPRLTEMPVAPLQSEAPFELLDKNLNVKLASTFSICHQLKPPGNEEQSDINSQLLTVESGTTKLGCKQSLKIPTEIPQMGNDQQTSVIALPISDSTIQQKESSLLEYQSLSQAQIANVQVVMHQETRVKTDQVPRRHPNYEDAEKVGPIVFSDLKVREKAYSTPLTSTEDIADIEPCLPQVDVITNKSLPETEPDMPQVARTQAGVITTENWCTDLLLSQTAELSHGSDDTAKAGADPSVLPAPVLLMMAEHGERPREENARDRSEESHMLPAESIPIPNDVLSVDEVSCISTCARVDHTDFQVACVQPDTVLREASIFETMLDSSTGSALLECQWTLTEIERQLTFESVTGIGGQVNQSLTPATLVESGSSMHEELQNISTQLTAGLPDNHLSSWLPHLVAQSETEPGRQLKAEASSEAAVLSLQEPIAEEATRPDFKPSTPSSHAADRCSANVSHDEGCVVPLGLPAGAATSQKFDDVVDCRDAAGMPEPMTTVPGSNGAAVLVDVSQVAASGCTSSSAKERASIPDCPVATQEPPGDARSNDRHDESSRIDDFSAAASTVHHEVSLGAYSIDRSPDNIESFTCGLETATNVAVPGTSNLNNFISRSDSEYSPVVAAAVEGAIFLGSCKSARPTVTVTLPPASAAMPSATITAPSATGSSPSEQEPQGSTRCQLALSDAGSGSDPKSTSAMGSQVVATGADGSTQTVTSPAYSSSVIALTLGRQMPDDGVRAWDIGNRLMGDDDKPCCGPSGSLLADTNASIGLPRSNMQDFDSCLAGGGPSIGLIPLCDQAGEGMLRFSANGEPCLATAGPRMADPCGNDGQAQPSPQRHPLCEAAAQAYGHDISEKVPTTSAVLEPLAAADMNSTGLAGPVQEPELFECTGTNELTIPLTVLKGWKHPSDSFNEVLSISVLCWTSLPDNDDEGDKSRDDDSSNADSLVFDENGLACFAPHCSSPKAEFGQTLSDVQSNSASVDLSPEDHSGNQPRSKDNSLLLRPSTKPMADCIQGLPAQSTKADNAASAGFGSADDSVVLADAATAAVMASMEGSRVSSTWLPRPEPPMAHLARPACDDGQAADGELGCCAAAAALSRRSASDVASSCWDDGCLDSGVEQQPLEEEEEEEVLVNEWEENDCEGYITADGTVVYTKIIKKQVHEDVRLVSATRSRHPSSPSASSKTPEAGVSLQFPFDSYGGFVSVAGDEATTFSLPSLLPRDSGASEIDYEEVRPDGSLVHRHVTVTVTLAPDNANQEGGEDDRLSPAGVSCASVASQHSE